MKEKLMIIGAGGHGRVVADCALDSYRTVSFLESDESKVGAEYFGCRVVDIQQNIEKYKDAYDFFVAIGNNTVRSQIQTGLEQSGYDMATLVHPTAVVGRGVTIGTGAVLLANTVVNCGAVIGRGCILNTGSQVDHDCRIGEFTHLSPGAVLAGTVTLGKRNWIGTGAAVINNLTLCDDVTLGAGAISVKTVTQSGIYIGVPAVRREAGVR